MYSNEFYPFPKIFLENMKIDRFSSENARFSAIFADFFWRAISREKVIAARPRNPIELIFGTHDPKGI